MKIITKSGSTVTLEDVGLIKYSCKTLFNPFVDQPSTAIQTWIFASLVGAGASTLTYFLTKSEKSKGDTDY